MLRLHVGIVYGPKIIRHTCRGCFTICRVIRHMYNICLLTKEYPMCDIEAGLYGSGAGGVSSQQQKLGDRGNPKTASNPVVCGLSYGSQLPRP